MEHVSKPVQKFLLGTTLSAALVALGLAMTGNTARALNTISPDPQIGGFRVLDGSTRRVEEVILNGRRTQILVCQSPDRSPAEVLAHYRKVAEGETPANVPYLLDESPGYGGSVMWVTLDGTRKSAMVSPDPRGGAAFRLITAPSLDNEPPTHVQDRDVDLILPGGLAAPDGFEVAFCVNDGKGIGSAILEAPGSCRDAAAGLLSELNSRGFTTDADALAVFETQSSPTRLTLPFRHRTGSLSGHLTVSPIDDGARLCLTVREGR